VRINSLDRVARDAVRAGIGWIGLNRRMDSLQSLRQEFPEVPICFVCPDQREIGRIQGRQFRTLLPTGGRILYVQGEATSSPAQDRLEGMRETIEKANLEVASVLDGNWTTEDAERVAGSWLRMVLSGKTRIDLIGCQSDAMAMGVLKALKAVAEYLQRPEIALIPVTGCDGVPNVGQKLVTQGQLAATVLMPSTGGTAVELMARALSQGERLPAEIKLPPASFPAEEVLAQRSRKLQ
jgi:ABC-type sugar transport system substrate-binding protein